MAVLVLSVGTINILLGYALAYYLRCLLDEQAPPEIPAEEAQPEAETVPTEPEPEPPPEPEAAWDEDDELSEIEVAEVIPADWVDRLEAESIEAKSLVEATAQVMRLEINKYREALVRLEEQMRASMKADNLKLIIQRLLKLNRQWLSVQAEASGHLNERIGSLGDFEEIGTWLEKDLLDQQSQIESTCNNLAELNVDADVIATGKVLIGEFARLVNLTHQLRDGIGQTLLTVLRAEQRMDAIDESIQEDAETGFRNYAGLEIELTKWIEGDPGRQRLASALLLDIGQMGFFNRQHGTRFGDRLLVAAGSLLKDVMRKDRGYEVVARMHGQQFLLFFGDTGPRGATSAAERIRQSFKDAVFEHDTLELELQVTCSVTELLSKDDSMSLLDRLTATLATAKQSGGNCTMLDEGEGPKPVTPPDYQIPSRVIEVE